MGVSINLKPKTVFIIIIIGILILAINFLVNPIKEEPLKKEVEISNHKETDTP